MFPPGSPESGGLTPETPFPTGPSMDAPSAEPAMPDFPSQPSLSQPSAQEMPPMAVERPMVIEKPVPVAPASTSADKHELILAKIDGLKTMLETINQRLSNLEHKGDRRW